VTSSRSEQVRATRQRVLVAARDLFLRRGYVGATIGAIADRAGVSPQSVYNVIGTKAAVLRAVYDVALAGDDEPVPMTDRPVADDPRECLRLYARTGRNLVERAGPLIGVVFVQGAGRDPDVRAFAEKIEAERAIGTARIAAHVRDSFGLRPGLDVTQAGDILWALTSPELADRFLRRCGWTLDGHEAWLSRAMVDALLP
jgi:AcrR family transcriptional regulator